jgi:TonB family protein
MLLNGSVTESGANGPAPLSIGFSVLLHACILALLAGARGIQLPKPRTAYQQLIQAQEHKLVWYHFKEKLPEIKPSHASADHRPLRAEVRLRDQSIVSAPRKAPKAPQMIWQKAPEIQTDVHFDTPNVVAVKLPTVQPPKQFVPPAPPAKKIVAPRIEAPAPPRIETADSVELPATLVSTSLSKLMREFKAPAPRPKAAAPQVKTVDPAPSLVADARTAAVDPLAETKLQKVYRPFAAPPEKASHAAPSLVVPAPPAPDVAANSPDLNVVVVGLNPGNQLPAPPPISRPAAFSAGPKLNPKGGTGAGDRSAPLSVPDLTIKSGNIDTRATIMARNTLPSSLAPNPTDALRQAAKYITVDHVNNATKVSNAPYAGFDGRTVYMMAIQMPNLTSYVGSWLLWFSERNAPPDAGSGVTPPAVQRKVDPKYIAEAVSERIEGTVRLAALVSKDGTVHQVELVHGLDPRLDRTAKEALGKWTFLPAMRDGRPIDVDILVEIPFRLAPRADR